VPKRMLFLLLRSIGFNWFYVQPISGQTIMQRHLLSIAHCRHLRSEIPNQFIPII
jgi:hypothetical protein